jgi:hypothetical protein
VPAPLRGIGELDPFACGLLRAGVDGEASLVDHCLHQEDARQLVGVMDAGEVGERVQQQEGDRSAERVPLQGPLHEAPKVAASIAMWYQT